MSDTTKAIVSSVSPRSKPFRFSSLLPKWNKWEWALVVITCVTALNMMAMNAGALGFQSPWLDWWVSWQLAPAIYWCDWPGATNCYLLIDMIIAAINPALVVIIGLLQPKDQTTDQAGPQ